MIKLKWPHGTLVVKYDWMAHLNSIPNDSAFRLWKMRNVVIEMLAARKYSLKSLQPLEIEEMTTNLSKTTKLKKSGSKLRRSEEAIEDELTFGQRFFDPLEYEKWAELFEYQGDPNESMDGAEYTECRLRMSMSCTYGKDDQYRAVVFWYPEAKLGKEKASVILRFLGEYDTIILVHAATISTDANASFRNRPRSKYLDLFNDCELYVNILLHPLVPPQRVLPDDKSLALLKEYAVPMDGAHPGMPLILSTDAVAKFLGARQDQVIIVRRPSYTQLLPGGKRATTISYRYVVTPSVNQ
jgi:DNA-directed RNA polymerase subunit H (RpoH/RPB5)